MKTKVTWMDGSTETIVHDRISFETPGIVIFAHDMSKSTASGIEYTDRTKSIAVSLHTIKKLEGMIDE
jgi:hypothetical protein